MYCVLCRPCSVKQSIHSLGVTEHMGPKQLAKWSVSNACLIVEDASRLR